MNTSNYYFQNWEKTSHHGFLIELPGASMGELLVAAAKLECHMLRLGF